jgi:fructose-1,6-bisphosphatase
MESYIVRVYRKSSDNKQKVAGLVEKVGAGQQKTFQDMASLQSALEDFMGTENIDTQETTQMDMTANEKIAVNA